MGAFISAHESCFFSEGRTDRTFHDKMFIPFKAYIILLLLRNSKGCLYIFYCFFLLFQADEKKGNTRTMFFYRI